MDTQNEQARTPERPESSAPLIHDTEVTELPNEHMVNGYASSAREVSAPWYKNRQLLVSVLVAIIILGGAGYYAYSKNVTGPVVAVVNGMKIYQNEFDENVDLIKQAMAAQGIDTNSIELQADLRDQALTGLIDNALLITASLNAGLSAGDTEVQEKYDALSAQLGGQEELLHNMTEVGLTEEKLRSNIKDRILVDKYLESETEIESVVISDKEVDDFYATVNETTPDLPPLEEVREQIRAELTAQKQQQIVIDLLAKLRSEATIVLKE